MADDKKTVAAAGLGITAGALAAYLLTRKVKGTTGEGIISLDDPAMQALLGILSHTESLDLDADDVLRHLDDITAGFNRLSAALGAGGVGKLENPPDITAFRVLTTAINTPVQLPDRSIPYDKELVIKALSTNRGIILVAPSLAEAMNINSSYWLIGNEAIEYKIKNANHIWISVPPVIGIAGEGVVCTVEQESR